VGCGGRRATVSGGWRWVRVWGVQVKLGECEVERDEGFRGVHGVGGK
jgi:hypothetical protein